MESEIELLEKTKHHALNGVTQTKGHQLEVLLLEIQESEPGKELDQSGDVACAPKKADGAQPNFELRAQEKSSPITGVNRMLSTLPVRQTISSLECHTHSRV